MNKCIMELYLAIAILIVLGVLVCMTSDNSTSGRDIDDNNVDPSDLK